MELAEIWFKRAFREESRADLKGFLEASMDDKLSGKIQSVLEAFEARVHPDVIIFSKYEYWTAFQYFIGYLADHPGSQSRIAGFEEFLKSENKGFLEKYRKGIETEVREDATKTILAFLRGVLGDVGAKRFIREQVGVHRMNSTREGLRALADALDADEALDY